MGKTDVRTTLARNIKQERVKRNWTRAQLAEKLGVNSPSSIGNWESGLAAPDCDKISMMADLFGVSIDAMFGRETLSAVDRADSGEVFADEHELLKKFAACDEIGQETILSCVEFQYDRCISQHLKDRPEKGKNTTGIQRLFLERGVDPEYEEMEEQLPYLRALKKSKRKSFMSITEFLWEIGYGNEICLGFVMDIFGFGFNKRVPCRRLLKDIENFLKGNYKVYSD